MGSALWFIIGFSLTFGDSAGVCCVSESSSRLYARAGEEVCDTGVKRCVGVHRKGHIRVSLKCTH